MLTLPRAAALASLLAAVLAVAAVTLAADLGESPIQGGGAQGGAAPLAPPERISDRGPHKPPGHPAEEHRRRWERIHWRRSTALGWPAAGRLRAGVRLPSEGRNFFTWDPVERRSPNRAWRRWGTDRLVRMLVRVAREFRQAYRDAPRLGIGDLSRPHGGDFGPRFGYIGHASHQNGLDADVYYPRVDRRERAPKWASQIDRRLSQELVDRFVAAGAQVVFVGPATGLSGPGGKVQTLVNHDNHMHVRIS
jgi:murein endopeptidase